MPPRITALLLASRKHLEPAKGSATSGGVQTLLGDHVAIAPTYMPYIAPHERDDMRFPNMGDVIVQPFEIEPAVGDFKRHGDNVLSGKAP